MILFFDTETTGKASFKATPEALGQPRIVQLAALLCNNLGDEISSFDFIIKPIGFTIPPEATAIHGINTETAMQFGVHIQPVLSIFKNWHSTADIVVAHNIDFDHFMLQIEDARLFGCATSFSDSKNFCTMQSTIQVCKLPGKYGDYKWPKLQEAYQHCFGRPFANAHNALADVRACKDIYFHLQQNPSK